MTENGDGCPDNEAIYDEQIAPLMDRIIAICQEHGLPIVFQAEYARDYFCTTAVVPAYAAPKMHLLANMVKPKPGMRVGRGGVSAPRPFNSED